MFCFVLFTAFMVIAIKNRVKIRGFDLIQHGVSICCNFCSIESIASNL